MIFEASPDDIERLTPTQLVELLRLLLHAEAQHAGITLSSVSVPLQINIADGGEDARVTWTGGVARSDYLPCRSCFLQSKATDPGPAGWKKEVWSKAYAKKARGKKKGKSQKAVDQPKLNAAVTEAMARSGAYIGFTSAVLVGEKLQNRIKAIAEGITEAGGNPASLTSIDIYDANKIASWTSRHPSVAVWLREQVSGLTLSGFRTIRNWGSHAEIASIDFIEDKAARFSPAGERVEADERADPARNTLSFNQTRDRIFQHLAQPGHCVAVTGPSGVGKTRFVYEILAETSTIASAMRGASAVFCDSRTIDRDGLIQAAQWIAQQHIPSLVVVDECSRETAARLGDIARETGSNLRVLIIGLDERDLQSNQWLNIHVNPSDAALIKGIIKQRLPDADDVTVSYIQELSGGYPRIADLATQSYRQKTPVLKSLDDVVNRVLEGARITTPDQVRAIETTALFSKLGADEEYAGTFDVVAERLGGMPGDRMFEHLCLASLSQIVDKKGRFFFVQPLPMTAFLGARRLDLLRIATLTQFIESAPQGLKKAFFRQWRYFDRTRTAPAMALRLLGHRGLYSTFDALNTEEGSDVALALVHVNPDFVADRLSYIFQDKTLDDLRAFAGGRRNIVWALEKLAFRKRSFIIAAKLLLRLAAAENESWGNNASGQFRQLFQMQLSGTEAPPADRFIVLDEGLASNDERVLDVCYAALENTLENHFSRTGGAEEIGSGPPLRDWAPNTWGDVHDYRRNGLRRLERLRTQSPQQFAKRCEKTIAQRFRSLLNEGLFSEVESISTRISAEKGFWPEAIKSIGDWLYFDRNGAPADLSAKVRNLYDKLLPGNLVEKALLYTKFWSADIRDPDVLYSKTSDGSRDYEYSTRQAIAVAEQVALSPTTIESLIPLMVGADLHNAFPFAQVLGEKASDPVLIFSSSVAEYERNPRGFLQFLRGFLHGVDARDKTLSKECLQIALDSTGLKPHALSFYTAIVITQEHLREVTERLRGGTLSAEECQSLSYGRGLDHLTVVEIEDFLLELAENHGANGKWSALEIISMYQFGRDALDQGLESITKDLLTRPTLLDAINRRNRDGHLFQSLIEMISKAGKLDQLFASRIAGQIVRLCQLDDYEVFHALDDAMRGALAIALRDQPTEIWLSLSQFAETATSLERHRLQSLIGPGRSGEAYDGAGILFGVPEDQMFAWADRDPGPRAAFLASFYPTIVKDGEAEYTWHDAMQRLANRYGAEEMFRDALVRRMRPSSWWGSIVPFLKKYLRPLEEWSSHSVPQIASWARIVYGRLENDIAAEKMSDEEDH